LIVNKGSTPRAWALLIVKIVNMYYDPFANVDPDDIKSFTPAEKIVEKPETKTFDPGAEEFRPTSHQCRSISGDLRRGSSSVEEVENSRDEDGDSGKGRDEWEVEQPEWQVVAAEYGGKAVAVVIKDGLVYACTSPSFHSECSHPGLPCMAWESVVLEIDKETRETSLASESPLPEGTPNLADSAFENGNYDNFNDNSSDQSGEQSQLHLVMESQYGGSLEPEQFSPHYPVYPSSVDILPHGYTTSLPEAIALAPDTIVVEHYPPPLVVAEQPYESWGNPEQSSPISWNVSIANMNAELTDNSVSTYSNTFNDPSYTDYGGHPPVCPLSPTGQTQFINLSGLPADMAALDLGRNDRRREKSEEDRLQAIDEQRKREEFKNKVINNLSGGGSTEDCEDKKIRDLFKDQVLSNLRKDKQKKESEGSKKKRAFKDQILSELGGGTKG